MTMRKCLFFVLALVLCVFAASAAQAQEQELISVPALSAGFGPSLEAANIGVANPFRLAAYAMDAQGSKISCADMARYRGEFFYIPRTALSLSVADLKSAYSACLTEANARLRPAATTTATTTATPPTTTRPTGITTTPTTTNATVRDLEQKLQAAQTRLDEVRTAAERRFNEIRAEEQATAAAAAAKMKVEFDRQLAAATQAAAGKSDEGRFRELEQRLQKLQEANRILQEEKDRLKGQLAARGGPPSPSWDWDGFLKTVGLKHMARRVVIDPVILAAKEAAQKRISEVQARGRTSPCALLVNTPSTEMPDNLSLFGGMIGISRSDCEEAAKNPAREMEVLAWNPLVIVVYGFLAAILALAWPGYRALRRFLNPVGKIKIPKKKAVDLVEYQAMKRDPLWGLFGPELVGAVRKTLQGLDDVVAFGFVPHEVWVRADKCPSLNKAIQIVGKTHPSLIAGEVRKDGGGYPYIIFTKYHNSTAPGAEKSA